MSRYSKITPKKTDNTETENIGAENSSEAGLIGKIIGTGKQGEMVIMFILTLILLIFFVKSNPGEEKLYNGLMLAFGYFAGSMGKKY